MDVEIGCYSDVDSVDIVFGNDKPQDQDDIDVSQEKQTQTYDGVFLLMLTPDAPLTILTMMIMVVVE